MTRHPIEDDDLHARHDPLLDSIGEVGDTRAVARLYRWIRLLAVALFLLLLARSWGRAWPVPWIDPEVAVLLCGGWLLATNAWSLRHDARGDERDGVLGEVLSDLALVLTLTVGVGDLVVRTLPLLAVLAIVAAGSRLPRRQAYLVTGGFVAVSALGVLARWPSWAGWDRHDDLVVPLLPVLVGLPLAAVLVVELAADRARAHQLALAQSRKLAVAARQLGQANRRLATSNEELGAFAGRIAHDLRSPLSTVVTALETLRRDELRLPDETRAYLLSQALRAATRSIDAVGALLDHATAEGRRADGALVDVGEIAGDVVATLPPSTIGTTDVVLPDDPALAWADPHLLRLVLQNLVTNALTHGGDDLQRVHVGIEEGDHAVVVSVEDDGVGIPADRRTEVFVPGSRTGTGQGLGLGLATCGSIVERHGGRIWTDDSRLGGAAVRFTLPWPADDTAPGDASHTDRVVRLDRDDDPTPPGDPHRTRATISSSGSSRRTSSASYRPGSAPTTVITSSPT